MIVTILGSGSAYGAPQAGNYFGQTDRSEPKNYRTRSSVLFDFGDCNFLIDAGPDFRTQLNTNNVSKIACIFFSSSYIQLTRAHTPQSGIISAFSALSSFGVRPVHLNLLPWKCRNSLRLRSKSQAEINFVLCKAFERRVLDVRGAKITLQSAKFTLSWPCIPLSIEGIQHRIKNVIRF